MIERFRADLSPLWSGEGRLGIAVSGGPDSLALLLLAHAAYPAKIEAATVEHGLRPESQAEAEFVAETCKALGVEHRILRVQVPSGNVQSGARGARYAALGKWMAGREIATLATAHHADDQAETFLMRANRGSGLAGLQGVRARGVVPSTQLPLVRPLLGWRKSALTELVTQSGLKAVSDPSNQDVSYDRVRIRKGLVEAGWIDPVGLAKSAALLSEAQEYIDEGLQRTWAASVGDRASGYWYSPGRSNFENVEIVRRIIAAMKGDAIRSEIDRMVDRLGQGKPASLAGVLARPTIEDDAPRWNFEPEPPRKSR